MFAEVSAHVRGGHVQSLTLPDHTCWERMYSGAEFMIPISRLWNKSPVRERDLEHGRQNENARVCRGRAQGNTFTVVGL